MSKKFHLTIPEPCHENWEAMTPVEKGRFCGACQKQVIDFTGMSDRQLAEFFKKPSSGSGCGRFLSTQLERDIAIPRKRIPWLKYFFTVALPAFLLSLKPGSAKAQGQVWVTEHTDKEQKTNCKPANVTQPLNRDTARLQIKGVVVDEEGEPLPGASIRIKGTRTGIASDKDGKFSITARIGDTLLVSGVRLQETAAGITNKDDLRIVVKVYSRGELVEVTLGGFGYDVYVRPEKSMIGFVTDEQGKPLRGVSVASKKRKKTAITDGNGKFSLQVYKKDILSFSIPGFIRQELKAGKSDTVFVKMGRDNETGKENVSVKAEKKDTPSLKDPVIELQEVKAEKVDTLTVKKGRDIEPVYEKGELLLPGIKFYPDPVIAGQPLILAFSNLFEKGSYQYLLQNNNGQVVYQSTLKLSGHEKQVRLNIPLVAAGNYYLVLLDPATGRRNSQALVIVR